MANSHFKGYISPSWSGFIDLEASSGTSLKTPGSFLTLCADIITSLSYKDVNIKKNIANNNAVIIFTNAPGDISQYGWYHGKDSSLAHPIFITDNQTIKPITGRDFLGAKNEVYENYKLAFSAYALRYNPIKKTLKLYYNYQPWNGEIFSDGKSSLFLENVSNFIFTQIGSMLKVQICVSGKLNYSLCKERTIY